MKLEIKGLDKILNRTWWCGWEVDKVFTDDVVYDFLIREITGEMIDIRVYREGRDGMYKTIRLKGGLIQKEEYIRRNDMRSMEEFMKTLRNKMWMMG